MNKSLITAVLLGIGWGGTLAQAQEAATCRDLGELRVERKFLQSTPLLDLVEEMSRGTGWKVKSNLKSTRGPAVSGRLSFTSIKDALRHVVERAVDAGWRIDTVLDHANCIIELNVDAVQLAALATRPTTFAEREVAALPPATDAAQPAERKVASVPLATDAAQAAERKVAAVPPATDAAQAEEPKVAAVPPATDAAQPAERKVAAVPPATDAAQPAERKFAALPPATDAAQAAEPKVAAVPPATDAAQTTEPKVVAAPPAKDAVGASEHKASVFASDRLQRPWRVEAGRSLRETITVWAQQVGWEIHWDADEDLLLMTSAGFSDEFEDAVAKLLAAINVQGYTFRAEAYAGNKVLRIRH